MKVKELRQLLQSIDGDEEVNVILNKCSVKNIDYAYYSLQHSSFSIYVSLDKGGF